MAFLTDVALRLGLRPAPWIVDPNALDNHARVPLTP